MRYTHLFNNVVGLAPPQTLALLPNGHLMFPHIPNTTCIHIIPPRLHNAANTILQALRHIMLLPLMVLLPLPFPLPPILPLAPHPLDSTSLAFRPQETSTIAMLTMKTLMMKAVGGLAPRVKRMTI